ncbi:MAG: RNA methyltransferase [Planctomycetaceae bacterium]|nr:RNA methyltransferase [Planctomycetaceae bacterium]
MAKQVMISSLTNPQIKEAVRLREGKHRRRSGRFLVDGVREILRAVLSQTKITKIFIEPKRFAETSDNEKKYLKTLLRQRESDEIIFCEVAPEVFQKMIYGERNEGILAVAESSIQRPTDLALPENPLICVLEGIEKPGNIGAVFRSADGAGLDAVLVAQPETDLFNPAAIRASVGTLFSMCSATASTEETLEWLQKKRFQIIAAKCEDATPYDAVDYTIPTAIVLGSESNGLAKRWNGGAICAVKIPMLGIADSLNISNAAAILFYEARRQRKSEKLKAKNETI